MHALLSACGQAQAQYTFTIIWKLEQKADAAAAAAALHELDDGLQHLEMHVVSYARSAFMQPPGEFWDHIWCYAFCADQRKQTMVQNMSIAAVKAKPMEFCTSCFVIGKWRMQ